MPPTSAARSWARNWARNETGNAMFSQIAHLLIQTAVGVLVYTLHLRSYMHALRAASFHAQRRPSSRAPKDSHDELAAHWQVLDVDADAHAGNPEAERARWA